MFLQAVSPQSLGPRSAPDCSGRRLVFAARWHGLSCTAFCVPACCWHGSCSYSFFRGSSLWHGSCYEPSSVSTRSPGAREAKRSIHAPARPSWSCPRPAGLHNAAAPRPRKGKFFACKTNGGTHRGNTSKTISGVDAVISPAGSRGNKTHKSALWENGKEIGHASRESASWRHWGAAAPIVEPDQTFNATSSEGATMTITATTPRDGSLSTSEWHALARSNSNA